MVKYFLSIILPLTDLHHEMAKVYFYTILSADCIKLVKKICEKLKSIECGLTCYILFVYAIFAHYIDIFYKELLLCLYRLQSN